MLTRILLPVRTAKPGALPSPYLLAQSDPHNLLVLIILICPLLAQLSLDPEKLSPWAKLSPHLAKLFLFCSPGDHGLLHQLIPPRRLNKPGVWRPSIPGTGTGLLSFGVWIHFIRLLLDLK